jgi:hypothetical protein
MSWGIEANHLLDRYRLAAGLTSRSGPSYLLHARIFLSQPTYFFIPTSFADCVTVQELPPRPGFPMLWSVALAPGWKQEEHNLRLADEIPDPDPAYAPGSLEPSTDGTILRIAPESQARLPGAWRVSGGQSEAHLDYRESTPRALLYSSPILVTERSGRYRFEFEIEAPGGEWRASIDDPSGPSDASEVTVGDGSLAHPGTLLLRPLRLTRRVVIDEWMEEGKPRRLYLRAMSASGSVSVSKFRVGCALTSR